MSLSVHPYAGGYLNAFAKNVDWVNDQIKVALLGVGYVPSQTHRWWSDVAASEVAAGGGYTTGGLVLASKTNVVAAAVQTLDAADVVWTSSGVGFSAAYGVIYDVQSGVAGSEPLIGYVDLGGVQSVAGGATLSIVWSASGIIAATVS